MRKMCESQTLLEKLGIYFKLPWLLKILSSESPLVRSYHIYYLVLVLFNGLTTPMEVSIYTLVNLLKLFLICGTKAGIVNSMKHTG